MGLVDYKILLNVKSIVYWFTYTITLFALAITVVSCNESQQLPNTNGSYFEPDSTTRGKLLNIEKDNLYDSLLVQAIIDEGGWLKDIQEKELKKNHVLIIRISTDASKWENPVLMIGGHFTNLSIFQGIKPLCRSEEFLSLKGFPATKIFKVEPEKKLNINLCIYYKNIFEFSDIYFLRIGEIKNITDDALIIPSKFELFSALNLGFVFETIGLISLFSLFFYRGRTRWMLFYFSAFLITIGCSSLQEIIRFSVSIPQFYFNLVMFILITFIPLSFIGFLYNALAIKYRKLFWIVVVTNLIWCIALPTLSFVLPINTVYWVGLLLVVTLIIILLLKEKIHRNPEFRYPLWGFILLILLLIVNGLKDFGVISFTINIDYGILVFVISLMFYTIQNIVKSKREIDNVNMELQKSQNQLLTLENENIQSQFEALKGQLNPHFLFNSLNTLASLINIDKVRATKYVEEFSILYRRLLDSKSETLVSLKEEFQFLNSYIYLQKIRFGEFLKFKFEVTDSDLERMVPPLSLQLLIENALKHNEISEDFPLEITIKSSGDYLEISNPLQPKMDVVTRKGIGLENLSKRYLQVSDRDLLFEKTEKEFIIKIPLIDEF